MKNIFNISLIGVTAFAAAFSTSVYAENEDNKFEIYGEVEARSIDRDDTDLDTFVDKARIGLKGAHVLPRFTDLKARWQLEFDLPVNDLATQDKDDDDVGTRKANISLQGGFGELIFGRQNNILAETKKMDSFKNDSGAFLFAPDRLGNAISYVTPTFSGLHGYVQVASDADAEDTDGNGEDEDFDATVFGLNYFGESFFAGISRYEVDEEFPSGEVELTSFGFNYSFGQFSVFGTYQDESVTEATVAGLGLAYNLDPWTFKVGHTNFEEDTDNTEGTATHLLASYAFGNNINAFIQYVDYDSDAEQDLGRGDAISIGIDASISKLFNY